MRSAFCIAVSALFLMAQKSADIAKSPDAFASQKSEQSPNSSLVLDWFRDHLRDFDSAKIENLKPVETGFWGNQGGLLVKRNVKFATFHCYRVNGKNAYGAYTGWTTYLLVEQEGAITDYRSSPFVGYSGRLVSDPQVAKICLTPAPPRFAN